MSAVLQAWAQVGALWGFLLAAYWLSVMEHGDDGVVVRRHRLAERLGHAATIDPGIALCNPQQQVER